MAYRAQHIYCVALHRKSVPTLLYVLIRVTVSWMFMCVKVHPPLTEDLCTVLLLHYMSIKLPKMQQT